MIIINDYNNNEDSQSAHTLRGIQPSTPWAACFWSDTSSAASPCLELPSQCLATAEPSELGRCHLVGLHRLPWCAEFALSYRGCKLRHTLYGTAECMLVFVHAGKEGSSVCKAFWCPNRSGQKLVSTQVAQHRCSWWVSPDQNQLWLSLPFDWLILNSALLCCEWGQILQIFP